MTRTALQSEFDTTLTRSWHFAMPRVDPTGHAAQLNRLEFGNFGGQLEWLDISATKVLPGHFRWNSRTLLRPRAPDSSPG